MRVLITGGAGFVGATVTRACVRRGWTTAVVDNFSTGRRSHLDGVPGLELIEGDLLQPGLLDRAVAGCEAVVHLAAQSGVQQSMEDPMHSLRVNGEGTLRLLQASVQNRVQAFLLASTGGAILGDAPTPVHEGIVPRPLSPYGASKLTAEALVHVFARSFGLPAVSLRFSNVYGPFSEHKPNAVPNFVKAVRDGHEVVIYGDGENTRDFLFVEDLAGLIVDLVGGDHGRLKGGFYHLGTGVETSVNDLIATLERVAQRSVMVRREAARAGEVRRNCADISLARKELGFDPTTNLETGLRRTWEWFATEPANAAQLT